MRWKNIRPYILLSCLGGLFVFSFLTLFTQGWLESMGWADARIRGLALLFAAILLFLAGVQAKSKNQGTWKKLAMTASAFVIVEALVLQWLG